MKTDKKVTAKILLCDLTTLVKDTGLYIYQVGKSVCVKVKSLVSKSGKSKDKDKDKASGCADKKPIEKTASSEPRATSVYAADGTPLCVAAE